MNEQPRDMRRTITSGWCLMMIVLGLAILARTLLAGGGALAVGLLLGIMFVLAGAGRLWTTRRGY